MSKHDNQESQEQTTSAASAPSPKPQTPPAAPEKPVVPLEKKIDPPKSAVPPKRPMGTVVQHTALGNKVIQLFDEYEKRMSVQTTDRQESMYRIRMLQNILNTACPQMQNMDMTTATDIARICYNKLNNGWGTIYTDTNLFRLGNTLKGTAYDMDKLVLFFEAYVQMIEGVREKKKVLFDDGRLQKVLRNPNVAIAMCRIRDNINKRNGFA